MAAALRPEVQAVLFTALSQVGVREAGSNRGPQVEAYLQSTDNPPGAPWCCAFTWWVFQQTLSSQFPKLAIPYVKSAYCPTVMAWADDLDLLRDSPAPGDTFLLIYAGRARHTGFVLDVTSNRFATIEGNTDLAGSTNGDGVYRRSRAVSPGYQFVRWPALLPPLDPPPAVGKFALYHAKTRLGDVPVIAGRSMCPVRLWGNEFGYSVRWDADLQTVFYDSHPLDSPVTLIDGIGHAPVCALAAFSHRQVSVDPAKKSITIS